METALAWIVVSVLWLAIGTLTYWLICDADDCADGHDDNVGAGRHNSVFHVDGYRPNGVRLERDNNQ